LEFIPATFTERTLDPARLVKLDRTAVAVESVGMFDEVIVKLPEKVIVLVITAVKMVAAPS
jgi:hypothetical protein